jgi:hypothetical protein
MKDEEEEIEDVWKPGCEEAYVLVRRRRDFALRGG